MMDWIFIKSSVSEMVVGRFEIHVLKEKCQDSMTAGKERRGFKFKMMFRFLF